MAHSKPNGFTLVELVLVVLLVGILAAVAAPRFVDTVDEARVTSIVHDLRVLEEVAERYHAETGEWPADANHGNFPTDLAGRVDPRYFTQLNAIGGYYDWNKNYGVTAGMALYNNPPPLAMWQAIDERIDDGNLNTGRMRRHAGRTLNLQLE